MERKFIEDAMLYKAKTSKEIYVVFSQNFYNEFARYEKDVKPYLERREGYSENIIGIDFEVDPYQNADYLFYEKKRKVAE